MSEDLFAATAFSPATVVNVKHPGARCTVYCGRAIAGFSASLWANPHKITKESERAHAVRNYEAGIMADPLRLALVVLLRGHVLGCWCKPAACHCDVLARLANLPSRVLLEHHLRARQSFGAKSDPRPKEAHWLEHFQRHKLLPESLRMWSQVEEEDAAPILAELARQHVPLAPLPPLG